MHRTLQRQLKKLGLAPGALPTDAEAWRRFLERVDRSYRDADQDRYTLERSLDLSSREMEQLYQSLQEASDSRLAEERDKLRAANAYLEGLHHASPDMIFLFDGNGRLVDANHNAVETFGHSRGEMQRIGLRALVEDKRSTGEVRTRLVRALAGDKQDFEWMARRRSGEPFPVEVRLRLIDGTSDGTGEQPRLLAVVRDISERKRTEQSLKLAATTFETHEGIFIADRDGSILRTNSAFTQITGYTRAEVVGHTPRFLKSGHHDPEFYRGLWQAVNTEEHWQGEIWNRRKNGEIYPQWTTITAVRDEEGGISHYVCAFMELTELKAQQAIIERKMAEEEALSDLLRLSLQQITVEEFLQQALGQLLAAVPWLRLLPKGGVFLAAGTPDGECLERVAASGLPEAVGRLCDALPGIPCACRRAAGDDGIHFASQETPENGDRVHGVPVHGYYQIPLVSRGEQLGVLALYVPDGHRRDASEESFLGRVADVLSTGIVRRRVEAENEYRAYHDMLTGLPNRRLLMDRLEWSLAWSHRHGYMGAVLFVDLDNFKTINDSLGHPVGDALLMAVARRMGGLLRREDTIARLGGDEFAVLVTEVSRSSDSAARLATDVAEKIKGLLIEPIMVMGNELHVTPSIGIALFPMAQGSADDVLKQADTAMYRAKESGRNTIQFFLPSMQKEAEARLQMQTDLRTALARGEMAVHYQPQVDERGVMIGAEALVRWHHPTLGPVSPAQFIPVAEETGLILAVGEWVLRQVCRDIRRWLDAGLWDAHRHVAVNVSPKQFRQPGFLKLVQEAAHDADIPTTALAMEITEGVVIDNPVDVVQKMDGLKALGVGMSLDDFGTGYSSLSYLKRLPLDVIKIDRSFVQDLPADSSDAAIVETIITMARNLRFRVIAEGVETAAQARYLMAKGCGAFQGYLFSRPLPEEGFAELLGRRPVAAAALSDWLDPDPPATAAR